MWLDKASGAKCYMLSARALSLPWDDGEFSWTWTAPPALQVLPSFSRSSHEHHRSLSSREIQFRLCLFGGIIKEHKHKTIVKDHL